MIVTSSSYSTVNLCDRRYYWRYRRGLVPVKRARTLLIGRYFHIGLDVLLRTGRIGSARKAINKEANEDTLEEAQIAAFLVQHYLERYGWKDLLEGERLGTEIVLRHKVGWGIEAAGVLDALTRDERGLWVVEHKTARNIDMEYLEKVALDGQVTFYEYLVWKAMGEKPAGTIYNVVRRPAKYRRVDETLATWLARNAAEYKSVPLTYFARQTAFRTDALLEEKETEIRRIAARIRGGIYSKVWPKNDSICFLRERRCPYSELCLAGETPRTLAPFRFEQPHGELVRA